MSGTSTTCAWSEYGLPLAEPLPFQEGLHPQLSFGLVSMRVETFGATKREKEYKILGFTPMITQSAYEKIDVIKGTSLPNTT